MERTAFSKAFKRRTGITFREFVWAYRISAAVGIIKASDRTLTEVAFDVGFGSIEAFERAFRKFVGLPPSLYRGQILQEISPRSIGPTTKD